MMYIHYCQFCHRIHMLNGHKTICPTCELKLTELRITYMEYIELDKEQRRHLKDKLLSPRQLATLQIPQHT